YAHSESELWQSREELSDVEQAPNMSRLGQIPDPGVEPASSGLSKEVWRLYVDQASQADDHFFKAWNLQMDNLILFAALFSAVLAAFVVESYQNLQADPNAASVDLLQRILATLHHSDVCINALWFASLVISISTAFLAILAKQWLFNLSEDWEPTLEMKGRQRHFRREIRQRWKLSSVLSWLPALLHVSLLCFRRLAVFLQSINTTPHGRHCIIYVATHAISVIDFRSPYKTSVTAAMTKAVVSPLVEILAVLYTFRFKLAGGIGLFDGCCRRQRSGDQDDSEVSQREMAGVDPDTSRYIRLVSDNSPLQPERNYSDIRGEMKAAFTQLQYLYRNCDQIDAQVLAGLLMSYQEDDSQLLAGELCRFPPLLQHRHLFMDTGALLLSRPLSHMRVAYKDRSPRLYPADKARMLEQSIMLTQLLTEADENDMQYPSRVSVDTWSLPSMVFKRIADLSLIGDEDTVLVACILRLRLYKDYLTWAGAGNPEARVRLFMRCLLDKEELARVRIEHLGFLVNTVICLGIKRRIALGTLELRRPDGGQAAETRLHASHTLELLAEIILAGPRLDSSALWQFCWGIWLMSKPVLLSFVPRDALIPRVHAWKTKTAFAKALPELLTTRSGYCASLYATLVLMETLLAHGQPEWHAPSQGDGIQPLTRAFVEKYPSFLQGFLDELPVPSEQFPADFALKPDASAWPVRILQVLVRISAYLSTYRRDTNRKHVVHTTLGIVVCVWEHMRRDKRTSYELDDMCRIACVTACHFASLHREEGHTSGFVQADFAFDADDLTSQALADRIAFLLQAVSTLDQKLLHTFSAIFSFLADDARAAGELPDNLRVSLFDCLRQAALPADLFTVLYSNVALSV
ncbi:uncharacterized protein B0H18DRAFT_992767, partial [Fomitopsis serialis]|uniref:uncharacterized protein n=1 Tax=Fomitopsis serialis TaxID=139415 RepID=UPI002007E688